MIDIFSIPKKTTVNRSLQGKSVMIVGKSKAGKSTIAAQAPRPIFLMTENGGEALTGFTPVPIATWNDFKSTINQLCQKKGRENFDTVVIDTYTNLILLLDKYIGQKMTTENNAIDFGSDADYGKGAKAMRNELGIQLQKLANMGYLILNIVHAEDKVDFKTQRPYIGTSLSSSLYGVAEKFVDQIIYLRKDEDKKGNIQHKIWYNSKGGFSGAGGRFKTKVDSSECSFDALRDTLLDAIDQIEKDTGATIVIANEPSVKIDVKESSDYDLAGLKDEFSQIVQTLCHQNEKNFDRIKDIIKNVLGPRKKVVDLIPGQEELLLEIIDRVKSLSENIEASGNISSSEEEDEELSPEESIEAETEN